MSKTIYTPYTYRITSKTTGQHYYGVRTAKNYLCLYKSGCHPDDFWVTYFTSSKKIKFLIDEYGKDDFIIDIRKVFINDSISARKWEEKVLTKLKVLERVDWLNEHIAGKFYNIFHTKETKLKISKSNIGHKNQFFKHTEETKQKMSEKTKGKDNPFFGKSHTKETKKKLSKRYIAIDPNGKRYNVCGIVKFCNKYNLDAGCMGLVARGKYKQHKGWTCILSTITP